MRYWKLGLLALVSLTLTSCGVQKVVDKLYNATDKGLEKIQVATMSKKEKNKLTSIGNAVANADAIASHIDLSSLSSNLKQCYKEASVMSNVPLPVMYAITMNETGFHPQEINRNTDGTWDCGIMQSNTHAAICPFAYYANVKTYAYYKDWENLYGVEKQLGLKYIGGMVDYTSQYCPLNANLRQQYCDEVRNTQSHICLGVFLGATELAKCWVWIHKYHMKKFLISLNGVPQSTPYRDWIPVAFCYNGINPCHSVFNLKCYVGEFAANLRDVLAEGHDFLKKHL